MDMDDFGKVPAKLSSIRPYLLIYKQFKTKDPLISYYAAHYAVQEGIKVGKEHPEVKPFLFSLLNTLEAMKKAGHAGEDLSDEIAAGARIEGVGLKLFEYAEKEDNSGRFHKNMVKAFFTASHIFNIVASLGELSEEIEVKQKYAKWKAVEIDHCLKSGIRPTPGPPGEGGNEAAFTVSPSGEEHRQPSPKPTPKPRQHLDQHSYPTAGVPAGYPPYPPPGVPTGYPPPGEPTGYPPAGVPTGYPPPGVPTGYPPPGEPTGYPPPGVPAHQPTAVGQPDPPPGGPSQPYPSQGDEATSEVTGEAQSIQPKDISKAQKMCKFASSALDYDDVAGAVDYLSQALQLLKKPL